MHQCARRSPPPPPREDGIGASFRHDGFLNVVEFNILQEKCGGIGTVQRGQGAR